MKTLEEDSRYVETTFWTNDYVHSIFTPEEKLFLLYLLTNPQATNPKRYKIYKSTIAAELGYSPENVEKLMNRFEKVYAVILYNPETHELSILKDF